MLKSEVGNTNAELWGRPLSDILQSFEWKVQYMEKAPTNISS